MAALPESISTLIAALARLPGIGPRSAERIALHLVQAETTEVKQLADAILRARERIRFCATCGALTEQPTCAVCTDPRRHARLRRRTTRGHFERGKVRHVSRKVSRARRKDFAARWS